MKIKLGRYSSGNNDTLGLLFIDCEFITYTLEDEFRTEKVYGETRIPSGTYEIVFRKEGGFHNRYLAKFGSKFHKGMLQLKDVPNFEYILIHIGNDDDDTAGCILVGDTANYNKKGSGFIGGSTSAYKRVYSIISSALESGEKVYITITDL